MTNVADVILDAAERRVRKGGYNGFSFREIANDVGVKSSSVHYHFPTKETLAAAIVRRYTDRVTEAVNAEIEAGEHAVKVWTSGHRRTLHSENGICPCIVLGSASLDLPEEAQAEVKRFFKLCLNSFLDEGLCADDAARVLAIITGAILVANATDDPVSYDRATSKLLQQFPSKHRKAGQAV